MKRYLGGYLTVMKVVFKQRLFVKESRRISGCRFSLTKNEMKQCGIFLSEQCSLLLLKLISNCLEF